jgi:hypothetical protein
VDISPDRVLVYQEKRLGEGAARRTVNFEVATLGRMPTLAVERGKISWRPTFKLLEGRERKRRDELRQAQEQQQAFLKNQASASKVVPLRTGT